MIHNNKLHKLLFTTIISLAVMSGCTKTKSDDVISESDKLCFNTTLSGLSVQSGDTRSYSADIDFAARGFTVAGYRTKGAFSADNPSGLPYPNIFDYLNPGVDAAVLNITKDNTETNVNRQYWVTLPRLPLSNLYNLSFFAWSSSLDGGITAATSSASDKGAPWLSAKVGDVNAAHPDIVGAASTNLSNEYTISAVDLDFKHLLSKMTFLIKKSNNMVATITSIECVYGASSIYSEGKFTFDGRANLGSWGDFKTYIPGGAIAINDWSKPTLTTDAVSLGNMVLIPQNIAEGALSFNITYSISQGGSTHEITRNVPLKTINLEAGKNYIYTLVANSDEIKAFDVKVENWVDMPGIEGDLPIVPGLMDPNVMLLLEGTDPPYVTSDGRKFWLDRSGWNRHCQIMDKEQYNGTNAFDITHNPKTRGYYIPYSNLLLYNHIRIPNLGTVDGNVAFEVICQQEMGENKDPYPFIITDVIVDYGTSIALNRKLAPDVAYTSSQMALFYGEGSSGLTEHSVVTVNPFDWSSRAFYFGTRNASTATVMLGYNNTNVGSLASNPTYNGTKSFLGGYIGPKFKGTINYLKIYKKSLSYDDFMTHFGETARRYNVTTKPGPYAPTVSGLLACWDARSGLVQGAADGNGAYWMDQSGNGYYLRADVPQSGTPKASIKHIPARNAIEFAGPGYYDRDTGPRGVSMINPFSMGKTKVLTFELVYKGLKSDLSYSLQFVDRNGGSEIVNCRAFTGYQGTGFELSHFPDGINRISYRYDERTAAVALSRQHVVATMNYVTRKITIYVNGQLLNNTDPSGNYVNSGAVEMNLGYTILGNHNKFNQAFSGDVHAFRIYNRELTLKEVQDSYNRDKTAFGL